MKATLGIIILLFFEIIHPFLGFAYPLAGSMAGPMEIKNQFPLFLHLNRPTLESAAIQDSFSVQISYSSIFFIKDSPQWSVHLDMEWAELNLKYKKTISNSLEISPETGINLMDNPAIIVSIGGRYYRDRNHFELSLTEDLITSGAPDFIINFSFKRTF